MTVTLRRRQGVPAAAREQEPATRGRAPPAARSATDRSCPAGRLPWPAASCCYQMRRIGVPARARTYTQQRSRAPRSADALEQLISVILKGRKPSEEATAPRLHEPVFLFEF